jgi:hypothetical protein
MNDMKVLPECEMFMDWHKAQVEIHKNDIKQNIRHEV